MGDRTNITDALERMIRSGHYDPRDVQNLRAAARLLRADPDTSDDSELTVAALAWIKVNSQHVATPLIAALLERAVTAEADRGEAERRERTAVNLANYHRDVARTAGGRAEHAEAEARQLREAIGDPDELRWHRWHCEETSQGDDLRELLVRIADAAAAAVAEGAEDRGQTDG